MIIYMQSQENSLIKIRINKKVEELVNLLIIVSKCKINTKINSFSIIGLTSEVF